LRDLKTRDGRSGYAANPVRNSRPVRDRRREGDSAPHAQLHLQLTRGARCAVRARRRIRMTLFAAVRDGQRLTRVSTVPVVIKWRKRQRRR